MVRKKFKRTGNKMVNLYLVSNLCLKHSDWMFSFIDTRTRTWSWCEGAPCQLEKKFMRNNSWTSSSCLPASAWLNFLKINSSESSTNVLKSTVSIRKHYMLRLTHGVWTLQPSHEFEVMVVIFVVSDSWWFLTQNSLIRYIQ